MTMTFLKESFALFTSAIGTMTLAPIFLGGSDLSEIIFILLA